MSAATPVTREPASRAGPWASALALARRFPGVTFGGLTLLAALPLAFAADGPVAHAVHQGVSPEWRTFWRSVSGYGDATGYVLATLLALATLRGAAWVRPAAAARLSAYARYGYLLLASLAASGVVVNLLKPLVGRLRPKYLLSDGLYGVRPLNFDFAMNSFPSGHAQTVWVVATVLVLLVLRLRREPLARTWTPRVALGVLAAGAVAGAALVAVSRVMVNAHFVSDVMVGSMVGIVATLWLAPPILAGWRRSRLATPPAGAAADA